jgi:hypothetical protein
MADRKFIAKLKESPMTIVAAMRESATSILLAGDSGAREGVDIKLGSLHKLRSHPKNCLAWGISGNVAVGFEDFTPWLESYNWPPSDWKTFRDQAIDKLSELNGAQRRLAIKAEIKPDDNHVADCLVVGWLDHPEIYLLGADGIAQSYSDMAFEAIGSGAVNAWLAHMTLQHISSVPKLIELQIIMDVVTKTAPFCAAPFQIWRITKDGIWEGLEKGEDAKTKRQ